MTLATGLIAGTLLSIGAVSIRVNPPFRFRSGMLSPIYTDNRLLCSYPHERSLVCEHFAAVVREQQLLPAIIAGVATAGIPHAAWLADALHLPMVYVRGEAKDHGKGNRVEGTLFPSRHGHGEYAHHASPNVLVVEDLVTTGGGALDTVEALRAAGATVTDCLAICTYGFARASAAFADAGVRLHVLTGFDDLVQAAQRLGHLSDTQRAVALDWQHDPDGWALRHGLSANGE